MTTRKFSFKHLTNEQLAEISATYPDAVKTITIVKPVYAKMAILAACGARLESGKRIMDFLKLDDTTDETVIETHKKKQQTPA